MGEIEPVWKILIVEDEALLAEEVHDRLTALDHEVVGIADNGAQAIALAEQHRPDLILMDIRIKGSMNGLETAARIYASHGIPVVFTSAHSDRDTLRQAQMPAQYGYVIKPFRAHELAMAAGHGRAVGHAPLSRREKPADDAADLRCHPDQHYRRRGRHRSGRHCALHELPR